MKRLALILIICAAHAHAQNLAGSGPISGYDFMEPTTQQLQDDDFINPAFFWLIEDWLCGISPARPTPNPVASAIKTSKLICTTSHANIQNTIQNF